MKLITNELKNGNHSKKSLHLFTHALGKAYAEKNPKVIGDF
ncbi:MAG: hypothetical protein ACJ0BN_10695 [Limisphaerales bacterium]